MIVFASLALNIGNKFPLFRILTRYIMGDVESSFDGLNVILLFAKQFLRPEIVHTLFSQIYRAF